MRVWLLLVQLGSVFCTINLLQGAITRVQGVIPGGLIPGGGSRPKPSYKPSGGSRPSYKAPGGGSRPKPSYKGPGSSRPSGSGGSRPSYRAPGASAQPAGGSRPSYNSPGGSLRAPSSRPTPGRPSSPSYGNALAAPISAPGQGGSLSNDQMVALVLEMHSMMQTLVQNNQRPPTSNSGFSSGSSSSYASPSIQNNQRPPSSSSGSTSTYRAPSTSNLSPSSGSSSFSSQASSSSSSGSSSFSTPTSSSSSVSSFSSASSAPDSYGNPLAPILPPSPAPAVQASNSYGSALASPVSSSNTFSTPQSQSSDPLIQVASTLNQAQYQTELATLDAVIEMLSTYQEQQARLRRKLAPIVGDSKLVQERRSSQEARGSYKPLRFPAGPSSPRVQAILTVLEDRSMDGLLEQDLTETQFQNILSSAGISGEGVGGDSKLAISNLQVDSFF